MGPRGSPVRSRRRRGCMGLSPRELRGPCLPVTTGVDCPPRPRPGSEEECRSSGVGTEGTEDDGGVPPTAWTGVLLKDRRDSRAGVKTGKFWSCRGPDPYDRGWVGSVGAPSHPVRPGRDPEIPSRPGHSSARPPNHPPHRGVARTGEGPTVPRVPSSQATGVGAGPSSQPDAKTLQSGPPPVPLRPSRDGESRTPVPSPQSPAQLRQAVHRPTRPKRGRSQVLRRSANPVSYGVEGLAPRVRTSLGKGTRGVQGVGRVWGSLSSRPTGRGRGPWGARPTHSLSVEGGSSSQVPGKIPFVTSHPGRVLHSDSLLLPHVDPTRSPTSEPTHPTLGPGRTLRRVGWGWTGKETRTHGSPPISTV